MALDLETINQSVTKLRADIPEDAFTAAILGSQRIGNGVVIDSSGLVLTIGYLMTEATDVWLTNAAGREIAAHPLAYDQVTGFGLGVASAKTGCSSRPAWLIVGVARRQRGSCAERKGFRAAANGAGLGAARVCRRLGISVGRSHLYRSGSSALVRRCLD